MGDDKNDKPQEMAVRLGVSVKTLQRWDNDGTLIAHRTPKNRRYYTEDQYLKYTNTEPTQMRKHIAYAKVSNIGQKADLLNQEDFLRNYVNGKGIVLDEFIANIGSQLNYKRKKWNALLDEVRRGEMKWIQSILHVKIDLFALDMIGLFSFVGSLTQKLKF